MRQPVELVARRFSFIDVAVILTVLALLYTLIHLGAGMAEPLRMGAKIDLNPIHLPYYVGRSLLRMFIALIASLIFAIVYGYWAAYSLRAEKILIPFLDILQSVPVLGFLSATITGLVALFPNSMLGAELASIFAVFTAQAWNITYGFYQSLRTIPRELRDAAAIFRLNWWHRLWQLELPFSAIPLVYNAMMSFAGSWFFLSASEAITVLNRQIYLPGLGSYLATAIMHKDMKALILSIITMAVTIVLVDQLFWRPVAIWSQRFKLEQTKEQMESHWLLKMLQRSSLVRAFGSRVLEPMQRRFIISGGRLVAGTAESSLGAGIKRIVHLLGVFLLLLLIGYTAYYGYRGVLLIAQLGLEGILDLFRLGFYSFLRVVAAVALGTLIMLPLGVYLGWNAERARRWQPFITFVASFPANMLFPFFTILFLRLHISQEWGAIPLMMLGTQWYILFNVIAGVSSLPNDLKEAAAVLGVKGWKRWRYFILPGIFPFLVTGGITAAGGAWNATIVAEVVSWGDHTLQATGLGAYITNATEAGNWPAIMGGIITMSLYVVAINRLFWRRLYHLAEVKYHVE
ncbi:binding-protein-dependent transport systems inner membrane component [Ammonifex degensii KC4]|uniref:Binding-protein-dependent transport systems inner membrane component n=1 Tax=Ammonifex degensii (strain DSM 10501 / KC4) TaxID=429009 RepID=C9RDA4_AMMDK|nr:ABC transporter permease subunit [Ammonifex degensii]ACX52231.1 binding-protein-dependent transport systems inner membrane component [Ammonifex degensii KC4]